MDNQFPVIAVCVSGEGGGASWRDSWGRMQQLPWQRSWRKQTKYIKIFSPPTLQASALSSIG